MTMNEKQVFEQLADPAGTTIEEAAEKARISEKSARNLIANLRRKGYVGVAPGSNWPKKFVRRAANEDARAEN